MNEKLKEAARLTREGNLSEALALIKQFVIGRETPTQPRPLGKEHPNLEALRALFQDSAKPGWQPRIIPAEAITPDPARWRTGSYTGQAGTRTYKLFIPQILPGRPLSLLVMLHGCAQDPDDFAAGTRMNFLADSAGMLVVYPEQTPKANTSKCWNWFQPGDQQRDHGEPSLIAGITRQIIAEHFVGPGRTTVAGLSAGGAMAAIMAATYPELYATVTVHSGLPPGAAHDLPSGLQAMHQGARSAGGPNGALRPPLLLFHGDSDTTVNPHNADELIRQWTMGAIGLTEQAIQSQAATGRKYTRTIYRDSNGRTLAERWTVHGAPHAWSGGSPSGSFTDATGPNASQELLRFFQEHLPV